MHGQTNPDERLDQAKSTLRLAISHVHLLMAQRLRNDRMERAETAIREAAETLQALADGNGSSGQYPS